MKINFKEYIGVAGDFHVLLIAETEDGKRDYAMYNRAFFPRFSRWLAERELKRRLGVK